MNISVLIFNLSKYGIIKYFSLFLSYIFIYILPLILIGWVIFFSTKKIYSFFLLFVSTFTTWIVSELIKNITSIERPITTGLIIAEKGFSFPSTHSAITMVLGVVMYSLDKRLGTIIIILSILVGLSRVVLGVHYLVDILIGFTVGAIVGIIFIKLFHMI